MSAVRHWLYIVRHEAEELRGKSHQLEYYLDHDLQRAIAPVDRMATALESYARVSPVRSGEDAAGDIATDRAPTGANDVRPTRQDGAEEE